MSPSWINEQKKMYLFSRRTESASLPLRVYSLGRFAYFIGSMTTDSLKKCTAACWTNANVTEIGYFAIKAEDGYFATKLNNT